MAPILTITPKSCLHDEKVIIGVSGLKPNYKCSIMCYLQDTRENKFFSYAHFISNHHGTIDTSKDQSHGGHYQGVYQMGLIAALQPAESKYLRYFKRDVENPNEIEIRVYEDFKTEEEIFASLNSFIIKDYHYRNYMGPGVKRYPVKHGRIRATLFVPPGEGPFPGVVDMFGTAGGLLEFRSAQLASRGIVALALAFFDYEDLPKYMYQYDLDYFKEAAEFLLSHDKVAKPKIGVIGVSKGADLALAMAAFIPEVGVAVSISGSCSCMVTPVKIRDGYVIPSLPYDISRGQIVEKSLFINREIFDNPEDHPECMIPIERSDAKFLLIVGESDLNVNVDECAAIIVKKMRKAHKEHNVKVCSYEGAGHLIEPPYSPLCTVSYQNAFMFNMIWGGELKAHTEAQEKAWIELLYFIKATLRMKTSKL